MKNKHYLFTGFIFLHIVVHAQVKIGDNSTTVNSASLLELETTNKGFVLPRVSLIDISSSSPLASGLLTSTIVYNTNASTTGGSGTGIYYWDGSKWNFLTNSTTASNYWSLTGNSATDASSDFIGTTDAIDFVVKTKNIERIHILGAASGSSKAGWIGMGKSLPRSSLDVTGNFTNKNVITIQNTSNTGYSSVDMMDDNGTLKGTFGYGNSGTGTFFGTRDYFSTYGSDFVLNNNSGNYNLYMNGSSGYIGINTGSPSERLHLVGNFYLNGAFMPDGFAGTAGYVLTSAGIGASPAWSNPSSFAWTVTGNSSTTASTSAIGSAVNNNFIGTTDAKDWVIATNNLERMRISSSGNIGINTISPAALFDIRGNGVTSGNILNVNSVALTSGNGVNITANALTSGNALNISSSSASGTSSALINLTRTGSNASQTVYGIKSNLTSAGASSTNIGAQFSASGATNNYGLIVPSGGGNVGIGTSSPTNALEVDGTDPIRLVGLQKGTLSVDSVLVITSSGIVKKQKPLDNVSLTKYLYTVTLPNISNNGGATLDVTVQNTPYTAGGPNPVITVNPEGGLPSGVVIAWVNVIADNTVRIQFRNVSNVGVTSQSIQIDVTVIQ
jgi:hypothetical protein